MFDRLDDILIHYEEIMQELGEPNVTENQDRFRKLMKEQADLAPLVEAYKAYKQAKQDRSSSAISVSILKTVFISLSSTFSSAEKYLSVSAGT